MLHRYDDNLFFYPFQPLSNVLKCSFFFIKRHLEEIKNSHSSNLATFYSISGNPEVSIF